MKYRMLKNVIAFGKTPSVGEVVEWTTEQAEALREVGAITPYEVKVLRPVEETKVKKKPSGLERPKSSGSARPARVSRRKIVRRSRKSAKKS